MESSGNEVATAIKMNPIAIWLIPLRLDSFTALSMVMLLDFTKTNKPRSKSRKSKTIILFVSPFINHNSVKKYRIRKPSGFF
jgi:hypothetical protein